MHCAAFALASCAALADAQCDRDKWAGGYAGPDAGKLIMAFGSNHGMDYSRYQLYYRPKTRCGEAFISHLHNNIFSAQKPDIDDNAEEAEVWELRLPPGDYEFYNFEITSDNGIVRKRFTSPEDFSVPFTIKPGKTSYFGDFRAMAVEGRNIFGLAVDAGAYFMISDQSDRDLQIAKLKDSTISGVENSVPDPRTLNNNYFRPMF